MLVRTRYIHFTSTRQQWRMNSCAPEGSSFWLTTYFLCLVAMFFNRQSSNLCVLTVHLFSSTCSFIRTRQISYRGLFNKCGNKLDPSLNYTFRDIDDVLPLNNIYDRVTRRMPLVEQKELTLPEHMSSSSIVVGLKWNGYIWCAPAWHIYWKAPCMKFASYEWRNK
jgi:hypothetical protein